MSVFVCLCVCLSFRDQSYLRNYTSDLHQIFVLGLLPMAVSQFSSDGAVIRYGYRSAEDRCCCFIKIWLYYEHNSK